MNKDDLEGAKKKRKRLGRKMLAAMIAMGILFVASVTVVATYFFQNTPPLSGVFRQGESSAFYSADGVQVGAFGDTLRLQADPEDMPPAVTDALVSLEDRKFWDHNGVNVGRTLSALVNNLTGGETQGASTITQQYAGMVLDARDDISYDRKAREAALAIKMETEYDKEEIIGAYLNMAYFGRGAYGIEAAAKNYFNVPLADLTYGQAAYIVMQVKSPNGYYDPYYEAEYDEAAAKDRWNYTMDAMVDTGYLSQSERDGYEYPEPIMEFNASGSWGGNTDLGFIVNERDGYVFDELLTRYGITKEELKGGADGTGGGYTVTLTIDTEVQDALRTTGSRGPLAVEVDGEGNMLNADDEIVTDRDQAALAKDDEGYVHFENTNDQAALAEYEEYMTTAMVAVDPETGAVLGYYGGDNGFGVDKAGEESPHPPSSTFKMITAATAVQNEDSIESWFNASSPREFDTLKNDDTQTCIGGGEYPHCTLRNGSQSSDLELTLTDAIRNSKNTPMYAISQQYGSDAILTYATAMGLDSMTQTRRLYDDRDQPHDVPVAYRFGNGAYTQYGQAKDAEGDWVVDEFGNIAPDTPLQLDGCDPVVSTEGVFLADPDGEADPCTIGEGGDTDPFYHHLAFGQYPTSVADMASVYATIANDGEHWPTHFIEKVVDNEGNEVLPDSARLESNQAIEVEVARDLQWVGSEIGGSSEVDKLPRDYFGKTGTWQADGEDENGEKYPSSYNAHAWYVGAIPQMAIAAWVGNATSESDPIADPDNDKTNVLGSNTAYPVWFKAMTRALENKEGDGHWDEELEWGGRADYGSMSTWDIEDAGGPIGGGAFCAAEPQDPLCAGEQADQAREDCEADGGTWDGQACRTGEDDEGDDGSDDTSPDPSEGGSDDEEPCGGPFQPSCDEDGSSPDESSPEDPGDGSGGD